MKQTLHIAIFAKAPLPGQVKTRLIPLLGAEAAAQVHRQMLLHALQIARSVAPESVTLWTAGDHAHPFLHAAAAQHAAACYAQCEGDIGARMADCLERLLPQGGKVLLLGSDCPAMTVDDLRTAAGALDTAQMVFMPAEDGGYVMVGACDHGGAEFAATRAAAFNNIWWSTEQVMAQTRKALARQGWREGVEWQALRSGWDIDTPDDYLRAVRAGLLTP